MIHASIRRGQRGQSATEFLVALPVIIMLLFGTIQLGLLYQGRATLNYATMLAARAGALNNGNMGAMRNALTRGMLPLFAGTATPAGYAEALVRATEETASAGMMTKIEVLSPQPEVFTDFGRARLDGKAGDELPNDTLNYRSTTEGAASKISIQDANLLHVRVTYCYRLVVPVIDRMLHYMLNTAGAVSEAVDVGMSNPFAIGVAPVTAPCVGSLRTGPRIHVRSEAIVRMQSPFYKANLASSGGAGTPGTPPGSGTTPGTPPPGTTPPGTTPGTPTTPAVPPEPDPVDDTSPEEPCVGPDCGICWPPCTFYPNGVCPPGHPLHK